MCSCSRTFESTEFDRGFELLRDTCLEVESTKGGTSDLKMFPEFLAWKLNKEGAMFNNVFCRDLNSPACTKVCAGFGGTLDESVLCCVVKYWLEYGLIVCCCLCLFGSVKGSCCRGAVVKTGSWLT